MASLESAAFSTAYKRSIHNCWHKDRYIPRSTSYSRGERCSSKRGSMEFLFRLAPHPPPLLTKVISSYAMVSDTVLHVLPSFYVRC